MFDPDSKDRWEEFYTWAEANDLDPNDPDVEAEYEDLCEQATIEQEMLVAELREEDRADSMMSYEHYQL